MDRSIVISIQFSLIYLLKYLMKLNVEWDNFLLKFISTIMQGLFGRHLRPGAKNFSAPV